MTGAGEIQHILKIVILKALLFLKPHFVKVEITLVAETHLALQPPIFGEFWVWFFLCGFERN